MRASALGSDFSKSVFEKLESEYTNNYKKLFGNSGTTVQIWHDSQGSDVKNFKLGIVKGATPEERSKQAAALAERIQADMVIYGYLTRDDQNQTLQLEFYYRGNTLRGEPDVITGQHVLGEPVPFPTVLDDMMARELVNAPLDLRSKVLFWITVALVYDGVDDQGKALMTLQNAERELASEQDKAVQALLHYFIGREAFWLRDYKTAITALNEAKSLDPDYANVYITLGADYYDRAQLFYLPQPIPQELTQCVSDEHRDRAAKSPDEAMKDIDASIDLLSQAEEIARHSPWTPIEYSAQLQLGHTYRLKGQAYLLASEHEMASPWFEDALVEFRKAAVGFAARGDKQYLAWTHLGIGATYQLQAFDRLADVTLGDDTPSRNAKYRNVATLFADAGSEYQYCINEGAEVGDLVWRKKVLKCGCMYYQKRAQDGKAQVEKLIQN
jgi:tetratricopeptide (TPR) repeat protein